MESSSNRRGKPFKQGSKPSKKSSFGGGKPFKKREDFDKPAGRASSFGAAKPYKKREDFDKPARGASSFGAGKPYKKREDSDKPAGRASSFGAGKPYKKREDFDTTGSKRSSYDRTKPVKTKAEYASKYKNVPFNTDKPAYKKDTYEKKDAKPAIEAPKAEAPAGTVRLNKYLAQCGIAARRKADEIIAGGNVKVNNEIIREMGHRINPAKDKISYKGKLIKPVTNMVYILLNKPKDFICTVKDERDRKTVLDLVKTATAERVFPVGRLDRATTGVLIITNDGDLMQSLTHPSKSVKKVYHAILDKPMELEDMERIAAGVKLDEGVAHIDAIAYAHATDKKQIGIELHIGWNHVVRRIFETMGYQVESLDRVLFAGLTKKDVPRGKWRMLDEKEVAKLKAVK